MGSALHSPNDQDPYALAKSVFENQTQFGGIFERKLGMTPTIARALAEQLRQKPQGKMSQEDYGKSVTASCNALGATMLLDYLDEQEIVALLR